MRVQRVLVPDSGASLGPCSGKTTLRSSGRALACPT
jgi:hypothetical protein